MSRKLEVRLKGQDKQVDTTASHDRLLELYREFHARLTTVGTPGPQADNYQPHSFTCFTPLLPYDSLMVQLPDFDDQVWPGAKLSLVRNGVRLGSETEGHIIPANSLPNIAKFYLSLSATTQVARFSDVLNTFSVTPRPNPSARMDLSHPHLPIEVEKDIIHPYEVTGLKLFEHDSQVMARLCLSPAQIARH